MKKVTARFRYNDKTITEFKDSTLDLLSLKVVSATFLVVCFLFLEESTCETRKIFFFYFTSKALSVLAIIKF